MIDRIDFHEFNQRFLRPRGRHLAEVRLSTHQNLLVHQ
jgi:hypothetical protein